MNLLQRILHPRKDDPELTELEQQAAEISASSAEAVKAARRALRRNPAIVELRHLDRPRRRTNGRPA